MSDSSTGPGWETGDTAPDDTAPDDIGPDGGGRPEDLAGDPVPDPWEEVPDGELDTGSVFERPAD